ncbi:MAG: hypothetical protein ACTSW1_01985 [Candidatus Hodarchaeales archaeon]
MVSSVAIDDEIRRRLKLLAAKYDTTQAEIIKRALEAFEALEIQKQARVSLRVEKMLEKATLEVLKDYPRRRKIIEALSKPGPSIDDMRMIFSD